MARVNKYKSFEATGETPGNLTQNLYRWVSPCRTKLHMFVITLRYSTAAQALCFHNLPLPLLCRKQSNKQRLPETVVSQYSSFRPGRSHLLFLASFSDLLLITGTQPHGWWRWHSRGSEEPWCRQQGCRTLHPAP